MFGNRLGKNVRHRRRWATRNHISCYRLYDRDIPEVPLALDWWDGRLHISHYRALEREMQPQWLELMVAEACSRLGLSRSDVFVKERKRQKGADQYERVGAGGDRFEISEGNCKFWVNLGDYLDTGLFLDHRVTRQRVAEVSRGKRMLNLFAYTASFSVHAAAHGALETTSVDLSKTYSKWARDNFELNQLEAGRNHIVESDVFEFLSRARTAGERYDVVVLDPPIFSNSKRMTSSFDVQRDHVELLHATATVLRTRSEIYFSTSRQKFKLETAEIEALGLTVEDITSETVPEDFRQRRPHRCFRISSL